MTPRFDLARPAELWFLYWKAAPSLWEKKISEFHDDTIFAPIHWGLHTQSPQVFDFGVHRPELDLERLERIAHQCGKKILFFLPIGPLPFVANGALAPHLVFSLSVDRDGLGRAVLDAEDNLCKLYSFYDPKVYQAFRKFVWSLSQSFSEKGMQSHVIGLEAGHMVQGRFVSFFEDFSLSFERGFVRFLQQQSLEQGKQLELNPQSEKKLQEEFIKLIRELYIESGKELMGPRWAGHQQIDFVGSKASDLFSRGMAQSYHSNEAILQMEESQAANRLSTCLLLSPQEKTSDVHDYLKSELGSFQIKDKVTPISLFEDHSLSWRRLSFFDILLPDNLDYYFSFDEPLGLRMALDRHYRSCYTFHDGFDFSRLEQDELENAIFFILQELQQQAHLNAVIRGFLDGNTFILDDSKIHADIKDGLGSFLRDNNINQETVRFHIPVRFASLNNGKFIFVNSEQLLSLSLAKRVQLWSKLVESLGQDHLYIEGQEDLVAIWKRRMSSPYELSFVEIRRLFLLNTSSYKAKLHIASNKKFALVKVVDKKHASFKNAPLGIDISLEPRGCLSLDFGYIGEG